MIVGTSLPITGRWAMTAEAPPSPPETAPPKTGHVRGRRPLIIVLALTTVAAGIVQAASTLAGVLIAAAGGMTAGGVAVHRWHRRRRARGLTSRRPARPRPVRQARPHRRREAARRLFTGHRRPDRRAGTSRRHQASSGRRRILPRPGGARRSGTRSGTRTPGHAGRRRASPGLRRPAWTRRHSRPGSSRPAANGRRGILRGRFRRQSPAPGRTARRTPGGQPRPRNGRAGRLRRAGRRLVPSRGRRPAPGSPAKVPRKSRPGRVAALVRPFRRSRQARSPAAKAARKSQAGQQPRRRQARRLMRRMRPGRRRLGWKRTQLQPQLQQPGRLGRLRRRLTPAWAARRSAARRARRTLPRPPWHRRVRHRFRWLRRFRLWTTRPAAPDPYPAQPPPQPRQEPPPPQAAPGPRQEAPPVKFTPPAINRGGHVASSEEITDAIHAAIGGYEPSGRSEFEQWVAGLREIPQAMAQAIAQAADRMTGEAVAPEFVEALREHGQAYTGLGESADEVFGAHTAGHFWRED